MTAEIQATLKYFLQKSSSFVVKDMLALIASLLNDFSTTISSTFLVV